MGDSGKGYTAAAAANPSSRSSPFAYQQRIIERSASKANLAGSSNGGSSSGGGGGGGGGGSGAGPSSLGGAGGMTHSGSVRRYPMPSNHRHLPSLESNRNGLSGVANRAVGSTPDSPSGSSSSSVSHAGTNGFSSKPKLGQAAGERASNSPFASPSIKANRMPPVSPRDTPPSSPTKTSMPGVFSSRATPSSPTKSSFDRPASPTKYSFDRPSSPSKFSGSTPNSPGKDDTSWIKQGVGGGAGGSFWANNSSSSPSTAGSSAAQPHHHGPSAVHLGGVGDLKRSSVGALKMMRDYAHKGGEASPGASGDHGATRMTVGNARGASIEGTQRKAEALNGEGREHPVRPGRMESEDQDGEIYIPGITSGAEDVAGLHGRIRLARQDAAGAGTIALGKSSTGHSAALGSLPFSSNSKWMDTQRHLLQAYEYLCHCGEAKQWMEACAQESLGAVVDMENEMRDGVFLAKVARSFEPQLVPRIFTHPKLQYRHTDNVNYFFRFVHHIGLPVFFHFELTDLYEKKNFPKVVYCIHALSHVLARQGRSVHVSNLVGKLEFTDDQLQQTQRGLDAAGVAMPSFGGVGKALAKEMNVEPEPEPEPEPESEEDRIERELAENQASIVALQAVCRSSLARRTFDEIQREESARRAAVEEANRQRRLAEEEAARRRAEAERVEAERQEAARQRQLALEAFAPKAQAAARGALARRRFDTLMNALSRRENSFVSLQAQIRGKLARNSYSRLLLSMTGASPDIIKIQAAARAILAKRLLLAKVRGLQHADEDIVGLQSQMRGVLARRNRNRVAAALQRADVTKAVTGLQSLARASLVRREREEQKRYFEFATPAIAGLQAQIRGALVREEYYWWREHLHNSEPVAIHLQSLVRGLLARRAYNSRLRHYHEQMHKVVKIQSLFRGKQQGEQYRNLTMGKNVPVSTIKNFGHLLNDSDHDFEDEIEVERLRKLVVRSIRENQTLENDVTELDAKIALLVKNKIGIEEFIKAKNERGLLRQKEANAATLERRNSVLVAAGDPFADQTLDRTTRRKLELYQELFYSLQTRPEYLARLFARVGRMDMADRQRKQIEKIVLTLFGYAQNAREEYLLLKLFQRCVSEEMLLSNSVQEFMRGNAPFIKLVMQYNRGAKERQYLRDLLAPLVRGIIEDDYLDLETDPSAIYRATINQEEMETGRASSRPLDVDYQEALADPMARTVFIRHLQALRATTDAFLATIIDSTRRMPFGIRYIGREVFRSLQSKFPQEPEDRLIKVVAHLVYYRYMNPAIVAPETFDVIESVVGPLQRKNLAEVSKMLMQISNGRLFTDDNPYLQPLNEYVQQASARFTQWLYSVIDVPDAEMQFNADEFLDATIQQPPVIYISPHEIYSMHTLVSQQLESLAPNPEDPLRVTLGELGEPPTSASQELSDARLGEITFQLVNRRTSLKDPEADTKALFVETKRLVLSLLKVQSGKTLMDVFLTPVSDQDEATWEEIVSLEAAGVQQRQVAQHRALPAEVRRLEDVRRLSFAELKARTLENMLMLERAGKVSRATGYQEMLNSIAIDIRQKHRKRIQRHNEKTSMLSTLDNLADKKKYLEEQIASYTSYVDASMQTMQKKGSKKRFVVPFSQQYFHLRSLKQQGKVPQFGSYKYTATRLHEKGILLKMDDRDFGEGSKALDQLTLTISSDEAGVFTIDASMLGAKVASTDLRIEDLLEQQHNSLSNTQTINIGGATVTLNLNLLIHLINRKFYA